jgi:hypothetical protein
VDRIEHYFVIAWPVISPIIGFLFGVAITRWILTDRYCPRCKAYREWNEAQKVEAKKIQREKKP